MDKHINKHIKMSLMTFVLIAGFAINGGCSPSEPSQHVDQVINPSTDAFDFGYAEKEMIICEGMYPQHLQGIDTDSEGNIYWSFTTDLIKTDANGKVLGQATVPFHHGDLAVVGDKVYVAVGFGTWNHADGLADSWIYVYSTDGLAELQRIQVPELIYGAGGIAFRNDRFFVVGGLPNTVNENYIYEYNSDFEFVKRHVLETGHTHLGIQTITYHDHQWWLGTYGDTKLYRLDNDFRVVEDSLKDISLGISSLSDDEVLIGTNIKQGEAGYIGRATRYVKK